MVAGCCVPTFRGAVVVAGAGAANGETLVRVSGTLTKGCVALKLDASGDAGCHALVAAASDVCVAVLLVLEFVGSTFGEVAAYSASVRCSVVGIVLRRELEG